MHLQVKVKIGLTGFPDHDDVITDSTEYRRGAFADLLALLEPDFNIRGASGRRIEFGGEFNFWAEFRNGSDNHEAATEAAAKLLQDNGLDAHVVHVSAARLDDTPGALLAFVRAIGDQGGWIEDITVGTPDPDGKIPVQIFTSRT
jgi:hypothetical protein